MTEDQNYSERPSRDREDRYSNREGYKSREYSGRNRSYNNNREDSGYHRPRYQADGDQGSYNRRPYRPRFQKSYDGNNQEGSQSEDRPQRSYGSYNREGGHDRYQGRSYGQNRERGSYQRPYRPRYQDNTENQTEGSSENSRQGYQRDYQRDYQRQDRRPYRQSGGYQSRPQRSYHRQDDENQTEGRTYRQHSNDYNPNAKYTKRKQIEYRERNVDPDEPIRLNKFLANAGICSRREADEYIQAGVVSVNGTVVTELGTKIKRSDEVKFHDQPVNIERKVYVLLNKPKDTVTTSDDPQARKTVMDLVKGACPERIYPVGRLDRNTTGVLLLTNDGDLASKLTHPKYLKKKIYRVHLDKNLTRADMDQILKGIELEDGEIHADEISYTDEIKKDDVGIEIHSGKNRIVRRIFEHLGYKVTKLDRVFFAGLTKKGLRRGDWRFLTEQEVAFLKMGSFE